jgi:hypothetical protein
MSNFDIKFFKSNNSTSSRLGGGYITSGGLKTEYSVFSSTKSKWGFNIALPYRKDAGTPPKIVNEVQFTTAALSDEAHKIIQSLLGNAPAQNDDTQVTRVVREAPPAQQAASGPTKVDVAGKVKQFPARAPF